MCGYRQSESIICCQKKTLVREPGSISKTKCKEYSQYAFERRPSPVLLFGASDDVNHECGHKVETLILGGEPAQRKEFPHMAAIGVDGTAGEIQWVCGGSIISEQFILTAGHCLSFYSTTAKYVRVGVTNLNDTSYHRQDFNIAERIPHPQYKKNAHYHDIGLLKLDRTISLNFYARPACLSTGQHKAKNVIASGWGYTQQGGMTSSDLLKVILKLYGYDYCKSWYQPKENRKLISGVIDEIQLCAGSSDIDIEKDTCQGDSGGPLQIYHIGDDIKCMYDIIGITSSGKHCTGAVGIYTRVSYYIKWIENIVWPQENNYKH